MTDLSKPSWSQLVFLVRGLRRSYWRASVWLATADGLQTAKKVKVQILYRPYFAATKAAEVSFDLVAKLGLDPRPTRSMLLRYTQTEQHALVLFPWSGLTNFSTHFFLPGHEYLSSGPCSQLNIQHTKSEHRCDGWAPWSRRYSWVRGTALSSWVHPNKARSRGNLKW